MQFLELPLDKLKNKVVCDLHFPENNFMNYKREKLNKTNAIPTIYVQPDDNKEVDLLQTPTSWIEENKKKPLPSTFTKHSRIDILDDSVLSLENFKVEQPSAVAVKRKAAEPIASPSAPKILNMMNTSESSSPRTVKKLPTAPQKTQIVKVSGENYTIRRVPKVSPAPKPSPIVLKQELIQATSPQFDVFDVSELQFASVEAEPIPIQIPQPLPPPPTEDLKPILLDSLKQIAEIKEMLNEKQIPTALSPTVKKEHVNISQSHLNKVQLFNGIKRYLSPSMNALLRIELFSTPNRDYKKDEKIICQELLQLGDKTYDFLTDEWRLRLPARQDVQQWIDGQQTEEDDDAS